ncbi:MAG: UDP-N-acetylmuramoyl-tripeptide--D-alanyl-D-alanine ligase [Ignavibacteriaceae bacterium]|nr:UDP-N-acetylmuramoyl-tripeptide--D-alanyl-D-alanine ligase [Ignavibacteriaceae bacterium]
MNNIKITLEDLFNLPGAVIYNPDNYKPVTAVSIDSRNIPKNALFIAIKGKKFNGSKFIKSAIKNGARAIVINKHDFNNARNLDIPIVTVPDTTLTLGSIAGLWRKKLKTKIIAITGSSGKTSTKDILVQLLSEKFSVNKTIGNNNNHIGVPLTILSTGNKHDILIVELGTNHFGEIKYSTEIVQPDFALITNIGNSHLEFFKNRNGVFKEKSALINFTETHKGISFINNDDKILNQYGRNLVNKFTFAFNAKADVKGFISGYNNEGQPEILITYANRSFKLAIPLYGQQNAKNFLAAVTIALKCGLNLKQIKSGAKKLVAADKRLKVRKFRKFMLIDDTYNANPESMKSSFELLNKISAYKQRIAIIGDMFELGKDEINLHKGLFPVIRKNKIDSVFTIGNRMKYLNELLKNSETEAIHFKSRNVLKSFLNKRNFVNTVILVKGSRGMKMEEFVQVIIDREI